MARFWDGPRAAVGWPGHLLGWPAHPKEAGHSKGPMTRVWMVGWAVNAHSYREKRPRDLGLAKDLGSQGLKD